jgi:hypothetical protein
MLTFPIHTKTVWNDYFTGNPTSTLSGEQEITRTSSDAGVHVSNCFFRSCMSTNSGGALFCTSVTYLLIESSTFFSCITSGQYGGAIYFYNSTGQCVLNEVCGYDCYSIYTSSSYGQFSRIYLNNSASSKNYMNYSSITRCVNGRSNSYHILRLTYGKICCPSVNISMNKCQYYSAVELVPSADSYSFTGSLTYCSITDNIANGNVCISSSSGGSNCEIKSCNILRNTQVSIYEGTIYSSDYLKIRDSCILGNNATRTFYASSYIITVSSCTLDSTSKTGNVEIQNTVTKSFILALNHFSTQNCHSGYDSAGTLTPDIEPLPPSKEQMPCITFRNFFYQPRLSDFFSLTSVFIFNFIHPYASVDLLYYHR